MGRSLYRGGSIQYSIKAFIKNLLFSVLAPGLFIAVASGLSSCKQQSMTSSSKLLTTSSERTIEGVAALGQLSPAGSARRLAAPISGFGGTPRVAQLNVYEGDLVRRGDVLAVFDNRPQILADISAVKARLRTLEIEISMQEREVSRYKKAAIQGAAAIVLLEDKQDELIKFQGQKNVALAEKLGLEADLANTELKSPIDGVVLRVHSRVGERPNSEGVLELGANQNMEALIEVYESDINRVKLGQAVSLISENGGFTGILKGRVKRISPQVRQRKVLSTDPTGDADARVVEVRVILDSKSAGIVRNLSGMKVIAMFLPS